MLSYVTNGFVPVPLQGPLTAGGRGQRTAAPCLIAVGARR